MLGTNVEAQKEWDVLHCLKLAYIFSVGEQRHVLTGFPQLPCRDAEPPGDIAWDTPGLHFSSTPALPAALSNG